MQHAIVRLGCKRLFQEIASRDQIILAEGRTRARGRLRESGKIRGEIRVPLESEALAEDRPGDRGEILARAHLREIFDIDALDDRASGDIARAGPRVEGERGRVIVRLDVVIGDRGRGESRNLDDETRAAD